MAFNPIDPRTWGGGVKAAGRALGAANPFDPRNTNRAGQALGNLISRNRTAERVVNTVGQRGGSAIARGLREVTGVGGFQRGATKAQQGDIRGALKSVAGGALNLGLSASGANAARSSFLAARAAGRGVMSSAARGTARGVFGDPISQRLRTATAGSRLPVRAAAGVAGFAVPGSPFERTVGIPLLTSGVNRLTGMIEGRPSSSSASGGPNSQNRTVTDADGRVYRRNPLTGINEVVGFQPQSVKAPFYDAEGRYSVYNPRSGIYEVIGLRGTGQQTAPGGAGVPATEAGPAASAGGDAFTVPGEDLGSGMYGDMPYGEGMGGMYGMSQGAGGGAGGYSEELAALSPEEMQELLEASRDAQREYDEIINQIGRTTAETERDFFDYTRGVGRQVAGGRQNVASQLAQLGMDTSPAPQAYADYLGAQGQRQIAGGRANVAKILADLRGQRGTAESNKLRRLRELDMAMQNARARRTVNRYQY